ncbi:MAG: thioredoxin, partial [Bacteroidales bacterium]
RILPIVAIVATITACGARSSRGDGESIQDTSQKGKSSLTHTISIDKAQFIDRIFDYTQKQDWSYKGDKPALVDFYADWCAPCKRLAPILEELAEEYKDKIYIFKVDTEKERELAAAFGIRSIPTLLFIPKGSDPQISAGAPPKEELVKIIETLLLGNEIENDER